jgi:DNA-binding Xre family transcriptional regulator
LEHITYLKSLKTILKTKGVSYTELAEHLKMSESGVKKMLNAKDLSFRRFFQICEMLNVLPGQVMAAAEQKTIPTQNLTIQQQELLLGHRNLLAVYWRITVEGLSPLETAIAQHLTATELNKALKKLVSANLLNERDGHFFPKQAGKFRWPDDSKIARSLNREWSELTLHRALNPKEPSQTMHRLMATRLTAKSYENLLVKLGELLDETVRISEREELIAAKTDLKNVSIVTAIVAKGTLDPD